MCSRLLLSGSAPSPGAAGCQFAGQISLVSQPLTSASHQHSLFLFFLFNTQFYLCPPYSQHMQFPLLFTGYMKAARHNLFQSLPSSNSFALTLHPFFLNVTWKMSFLSPINAIALWHGVEPWWHNGEQGKCTLRDTAHLSAGEPHLCSDSHPRIFWGPFCKPVTYPSPCHLQNSFKPGSIVALAQALAPWKAGLYCTYVFSLSIYSLSHPHLTSTPATYVGKALVEDINDCIPAKPSAINPMLTLLDPSESFSALLLSCNPLPLLFPGGSWSWFLHVRSDHFHFLSQLPHPFHAYSLNVQALSHLCLFSCSLLFLTSRLQSAFYWR